MAKHAFQTEVSRLLHLIIHSLYSNTEIFLRELVSNSSDALDKLRHLTLTDDDFKGFPFMPRIDVSFSDGDSKTISVADSGIGMSEAELQGNLGTIARSGTSAFLEALGGDGKADANLIGQFGVGFYSTFMVADRVEVTSLRAGEDKAHTWVSDGQESYEIEPAERDGVGTTVTLMLNDAGAEFASRFRLESIIKRYSDHIPFPIHLHYEEKTGSGDDAKTETKVEQVNSASALWRRPKSELTDDDYREFYGTIAHESDDPFHWVHTQAEGTLEYTTLFYIPRKAPFDLYQVDYQAGVKLYVRRVFITDDAKELMPTYLRFLRGIIDSEDLPLNVSREILQQNRVLAQIRQASVKKVLGELADIADKNPDRYVEFIEQFGRLLKEGLYQDFANRDALLALVRFKSTAVDGYTSLASYKERMRDDQKAIYYITGDDSATLSESPLLEAYRKQEIEVLLMADEIDDIVMPSLGTYEDLPFKSVNRSGTADDLASDADNAATKAAEPVVKRVKKALGDVVKDVKVSQRLADSPSCVVADENDPSLSLQQLMKAMGQTELPEIKPILELNPTHPIIKGLVDADDTVIADAGQLLLEQALLIEGVAPRNPVDFARRLNRFMERALTTSGSGTG